MVMIGSTLKNSRKNEATLSTLPVNQSLCHSDTTILSIHSSIVSLGVKTLRTILVRCWYLSWLIDVDGLAC